MAEGTGGMKDQEVGKVGEANKTPVVNDQKPPETPQSTTQTGNSQEKSSKIDFGKNLHAAEHVDRVEVEALVRKIGEFHDVPQSAIEQGLKSEIYVMDNEAFNQSIKAYIKEKLQERGITEKELIKEDDGAISIATALGKDIGGLNKKIAERNQALAQSMEEEAQAAGGVCIPKKEGAIVLIRKDSGLDKEEVKIHELLHVMASRDNNTGGGFKLENRAYHYTNEAATQILTLAFRYPNITVEELADKIVLNKEVKTIYGKIVARLLTAMLATGKSKEPFTFKDLSECYFHGGKGEGVYLMQVRLIKNAMENMRGTIQDWLVSDLKSKQSK